MRIKWFFFLKIISAIFIRFFEKRNQKTLNVRKIRNYDEEKVFFENKERFHLFKSFHFKNGYAQHMPVVAAGRLVLLSTESLLKMKAPASLVNKVFSSSVISTVPS